MTLEELKIKLSEFGDIQIIKEGYVFTLFMTGKNLSNWKIYSGIQDLILKYTKDKFPIVEALKNDSTFFCMVLKPNN